MQHRGWPPSDRARLQVVRQHIHKQRFAGAHRQSQRLVDAYFLICASSLCGSAIAQLPCEHWATGASVCHQRIRQSSSNENQQEPHRSTQTHALQLSPEVGLLHALVFLHACSGNQRRVDDQLPRRPHETLIDAGVLFCIRAGCSRRQGSCAFGKGARTGTNLNDTVRFTKDTIKDAAPLDTDAASAAGIKAILNLQEGEGHDQWPYEGVYREDNGVLPIGYRVGGTAIVGLALIAVPGYSKDEARQAALLRGLAFILKSLDVPRMQNSFEGTYDVRGWGHIFALHLFLELAAHNLIPAVHAAAVADQTKLLVKTLCESAIPDSGGWNYSRTAGYMNPKNRASTFMTAPALQVLFLAKARGYEVSDQVIDQALASLERARSDGGGYGYGASMQSQNAVPEEKLAFMDKVPSSASRATACEVTLMLGGRGDQDRLHRSVLRFSRTGTNSRCARVSLAPTFSRTA